MIFFLVLFFSLWFEQLEHDMTYILYFLYFSRNMLEELLIDYWQTWETMVARLAHILSTAEKSTRVFLTGSLTLQSSSVYINWYFLKIQVIEKTLSCKLALTYIHIPSIDTLLTLSPKTFSSYTMATVLTGHRSLLQSFLTASRDLVHW